MIWYVENPYTWYTQTVISVFLVFIHSHLVCKKIDDSTLHDSRVIVMGTILTCSFALPSVFNSVRPSVFLFLFLFCFRFLVPLHTLQINDGITFEAPPCHFNHVIKWKRYTDGIRMVIPYTFMLSNRFHRMKWCKNLLEWNKNGTGLIH